MPLHPLHSSSLPNKQKNEIPHLDPSAKTNANNFLTGERLTFALDNRLNNWDAETQHPPHQGVRHSGPVQAVSTAQETY